MATALDQSPSNPRGLAPYQWTNWQQVFQPRLAAQLQPQSSPGFMGVGGGAASPQQILDDRNAQRNKVIADNPLWKAFRQQPQYSQGGMFANVQEPGSAAEDNQSFFGNINDGTQAPVAPASPGTPASPAPVASSPTAPSPQATVAPQTYNSFRNKYGYGYSVFNNTARLGMLGGGGTKLRF